MPLSITAPRDVREEGYPPVASPELFDGLDVLDGICIRALASRDCPSGHTWLDGYPMVRLSASGHVSTSIRHIPKVGSLVWYRGSRDVCHCLTRRMQRHMTGDEGCAFVMPETEAESRLAYGDR